MEYKCSHLKSLISALACEIDYSSAILNLITFTNFRICYSILEAHLGLPWHLCWWFFVKLFSSWKLLKFSSWNVTKSCIVSWKDFKDKILNWSTLLPLLLLHTYRAGKRGQQLRELSINSETAIWKCYIKNICSENF